MPARAMARKDRVSEGHFNWNGIAHMSNACLHSTRHKYDHLDEILTHKVDESRSHRRVYAEYPHFQI